jgi:hypothetical protein
VRFLHNAGVANTFVGENAGDFGVTGAGNTALGAAALGAATTGARNVAIGANAGTATTTASDNIFVGADVTGTATDANTIRIGLPFNAGTGQNKTFIAGITGTVLTTPAVQVFVDANGQLGTLTAPPIVGAIDEGVTPGATPREAALLGEVQAQRSLIAGLQARLATLEAQVATLVRRR